MRTNANTAIVQPPTTNQPQRQTAKEAIAANVKALIEQIEAGQSDALTVYLNAMSRFHNYSFGNILEIARQKPDATRVAGMYAWNQLGRRVKKGERGIRILAPIIGVKRKPKEEAEKDITKQNQPVLVGFRNAYVFDISQTDGAELPAMREITGDVGENRERLIAFIEKQGIELEFNERIAPALGISYGGKIVLLPGQSKAEESSTLVHELAHEMLHKADRRTATTKVVRETEAEQDITKQNVPVLVGFRAVYVFDVSQTEGKELPGMDGVKGEVGEHRDRLIDFITTQGIELEFNEHIAPAMGMSYGGKIVLLPGQSKAEEFATLVHELAHEMLHKAERRTQTTKTVRETEAEAIAFVVSKAVGLQTGTASADYIQLYHGNASLLAESLEVIQKASAVILAALEAKPEVEEQQPTDAMAAAS